MTNEEITISDSDTLFQRKPHYCDCFVDFSALVNHYTGRVTTGFSNSQANQQNES